MTFPAAVYLSVIAATLAAAPDKSGDTSAPALAQSYAHEKKGDYPHAIAALVKQGKSPADAYLLNFRLGWLHYVNGQYEEAERRYQAAIAVNPKSVEAKLGCLLPMLASMHYPQAEALARQIVKDDPRNYYANLRLVVALRAQQKFDDARNIIEAMLVTYPADTRFQRQLAILSAAETVGDAAPRPSDTNQPAMEQSLAKSRQLEQQGNYAEAISAIQEQYAAHPQDYHLNLTMGWLHYVVGDYRSSANHYYAALRAAPQSSEAGVGYLLPLLALGRYESAESFARQITKGDPRNYYASLRLAVALRLQGKYAEAEKVVAPMLDAYPTNVSFISEMALLKLAGDRKDEAKQLFAHVLCLDPENVVAKKQVGL